MIAIFIIFLLTMKSKSGRMRMYCVWFQTMYNSTETLQWRREAKEQYSFVALYLILSQVYLFFIQNVQPHYPRTRISHASCCFQELFSRLFLCQRLTSNCDGRAQWDLCWPSLFVIYCTSVSIDLQPGFQRTEWGCPFAGFVYNWLAW